MLKYDHIDDSMRFNTNGAEKMRIKSNGYVGIGITTPTHKLDVTGVVLARSGLGVYNNASITNYNAGGSIKFFSSADIAIRNSANNEYVRFVSSTKNVGIGTASPNSETTLHVSASDTSPTLSSTAPTDVTAIFSNSDTQYGTMFATDSSGKGYIQQRRVNAATYYDLLLQPHGGNVGIGTTSPAQALQLPDSEVLALGTGADLKIYPDGSNSFIKDTGTGDWYIDSSINFFVRNQANGEVWIKGTDEGVSLRYKDNQKIITTNTGIDVTGEVKGDSLDIDGAADISGDITSASWRGDRITTAYQYQRQTFEFKGYATHDGTNYEIANIMTDTNAPFEHDESIGADGTTAIAVSKLIRAAGQLMPYAGTIKKWLGFAAGSGSGTTNIALFRYRPDPSSTSAQSLVLIDDQALTMNGNNGVVQIDQSSFTDPDIAAGDIILTGIKGVSAKTTYFTSTLEIEWD